jgi:hypothetical protein
VLDAHKMFDLESDDFGENWPVMTKNIIVECRKPAMKRNKAVQYLLDLLTTDDDVARNLAVAILLLPHLIPPSVVKTSTGKAKNSKVETQEEFVKFYEVRFLCTTVEIVSKIQFLNVSVQITIQNVDAKTVG